MMSFLKPADRFVTKRLVMVIGAGGGVGAMSLAFVSAQEAVTKVSPSDGGFSMKEAEAWIMRELPTMGSDYVESSMPRGTLRIGRTIQLDSATLSECHLTVQYSFQEKDLKSKKALGRGTGSVTATLKQVAVNRIQVQEGFVNFQKHGYLVSLFSEPDNGEPFTSTDAINGQPGITKQTQKVYVWVKNQNVATQVASVLRRAAILCGAHDTPPLPPSATAPSTGGQQQPSASGAMTNDQVVQLVGAHVSDEVIIGAIRTASSRAFDLSVSGLLSLKKAGVSDAVIGAMQTGKN
jgi:hypothetical protein